MINKIIPWIMTNIFKKTLIHYHHENGEITSNYTKMMVDMFSENMDLSFKPLFYRLKKEIKNRDRKWWEYWKPRMVPNPDYIGIKTEDGIIELDIVRGNQK